MAQQRRPQQRQQPTGEQAVETPGQPTPILPEVQVAHPDEPAPRTAADDAPVEEKDEITTMGSIFSGPEIEVDAVEEPRPQPPSNEGMAVIRMNTTLEDFTYGNPYQHYKLEEGKRYRVPVHIAQYLDGLGYVWH